MSSSSNAIMPCAACKFLRRKCTNSCVFLPHFPPAHPERFAAVHHVFGASNFAKLLHEVAVDNRADAAKSMVYEATARQRDPVYGCVGIISVLQERVFALQSELNRAVAEATALKAQLSNAFSSRILHNHHPTPAIANTAFLTPEASNSLDPTQFLNQDLNMMNSFDSILFDHF